MALVSPFLPALAVASALALALAQPQCMTGQAFMGVPLTVSVPAPQGRNFTVPPISPELVRYEYALDNAFLVLPGTCTQRLGLEPNVGDLNQAIEMWMGRINELSGQKLGMLSGCACGWVIFLHGSGGFTFDNPRYCTFMAAAGYAVLAPDSFSSNLLGLRYKAPIKNLSSRLRAINKGPNRSYWCDNSFYDASSECPSAMAASTTSDLSYPMCYSSSVPAILHDPRGWQQFYERVYYVRKLELDSMMARMPHFVKTASKVFLAGESEGGMVASRYYHASLEPLLLTGGRILLQWSCQYSYFLSCPESALIGEGKADVNTRMLSMIGSYDTFFGRHNNSVAWQVAHANGGYGLEGVNETGNCYSQMHAQGFKHFDVLEVDTVYPLHGLTVTTGNLVRAALWAFLDSHAVTPALEGKGLCKVSEGVAGWRDLAECHEPGGEDLIPGAQVAPCASPTMRFHAHYRSFGSPAVCGAPLGAQGQQAEAGAFCIVLGLGAALAAAGTAAFFARKQPDQAYKKLAESPPEASRVLRWWRAGRSGGLGSSGP